MINMPMKIKIFIIIFFIIGCEFFITYRLSFRKPAKKEAAEHV